MAEQKIIRKFSAETKTLEDSRSVVVTISTSSPDRDGDVVVPKGAKIANFLKNPVVLFGHKYNEPPIGRAEEITIDEDAIRATVKFPEEGKYAFADTIYELIKAKIMNAWSIGFQPDLAVAEHLDGGGLKFNQWELLEFSAVPVPANPEALTIARSKGLSEEEVKEVTEPEAKELIVEVGIKGIAFDFEQDTYTLKYTVDGEEKQVTQQMTDELKAQFPLGSKPPEELADALTATDALKALRDALKPADKSIGLLLRELNTQLKHPSK